MFSMELSIQGAFDFVDYESEGGGGGPDTHSNFDCIIDLLLIITSRHVLVNKL